MVNNHQGAKWWFYLFISLRKGYFWGVGSKKISFGGIPNSRNVLFLQIFLKRAAKPSAGNTSAGFPSITWPQILLNLTSLCTKDSHTFSRTLFGILLNLTGLCTKASRNLLRNLLRNPVEPDLALHQSLPHLLPNLPSPEPCWTWPGSAPKPPRPSLEPSPEPSLEPDHALHQSPPDLLRNILRTLVEPDPAPAPKPPKPSPEPSPEPCWTWPGSAPKPPRPLPELFPEPCWTSPGSPPKPPKRSREPSGPSPEPRWTWPGACTSAHRSYSGLKIPLAYAVGEKIVIGCEVFGGSTSYSPNFGKVGKSQKVFDFHHCHIESPFSSNPKGHKKYPRSL